MISPLLSEVVSGQAPEPVLFTTEQYHRLTETGVLLEGSPIELIEGVIVCKDRRDAEGSAMNHGPKHASVLTGLFELLDRELSGMDYHIRSQLPVTLSSHTEPEPDLAVVSGTSRGFYDHHPGPADLLLVVEVADNSKRFDRTTKQRIYATANIPYYWIVNLSENQLEVFQQPDPAAGQYKTTAIVGAAETADLQLLDGSVISNPLASFLPPV